MAINVLEPEIYNRISAGEVVEKPASVVKELVENSIDAKATTINISILSGGIEQIKVTDNGTGIAPEDMQKAFLPHATSKIANVEDLDNIFTLGFRGEALASIASVSQIKTISKREEDETGKCLEINGGKIEDLTDCGCPTGTQITVNNLFYNTPVRYKFLRKPKQEENEITNLVSRFILANPQINFTYTVDNKIVYQNSSSDLKQAIYVVYGKECYEALKEVTFNSPNLKISGYIGKPSYVKPNRTYQTLMVNGRVVTNQTVSTAVYNAFGGYLMVGKFPFFVLNLTIPYNSVDVNIHPTKMDVKFENANEIFKAVYVAVKNALDEVETIIDYKVEEEKIDETKIVNSPVNLNKLETNEGVSFGAKLSQDNNIEKFNKEKENLIKSYNNLNPYNNLSPNEIGVADEPTLFRKILDKEITELEEKKKEYIINEELTNLKPVQQSLDLEDFSYKIAGKLFNTYLIIEKENECYIIDQHAGHERIMFDKFYNQTLNNSLVIQPLLIPQIISVNRIEHDFIMDKIDNLKELGFDVQEFGENEFKINSVPQLLCEIDLQQFFNDLLNDLSNLKTLTNAEIIRDKLATKACKSAVKGGDDLSESEIKAIVNAMNKQSTPYLCPHGRPIIIRLTKSELEKMFKRIV